MTTLAELVELKTDAAFGAVIQIPAAFGEWRFALELADPLMGTDVEWFDITQFYASDRYQRGASEYMGKYRAGVAQVHLTINNVLADDLGVSRDILAPWGFDTTPLFGENVILDAGLLMRASIFRVDSMTIDWYPLWTGRVETWGDAATARGQIRDHLVVVSDLIGDLVNVPTQAADEPWEDWIVDQVLAQANWPYGVEVFGDIGSPNLPARGAPQPSAINEMDAATDPLGLVWRTLRNGKLVVHPAPWDTTNTNRYDNPLLTLYPGGLVFDWNPDVTEIAYIIDDDNEPAGLQRTSLGIVNTVAITMPSGPYLIDNPTSQSKYGMRGYTATWIVDNEPVADDILTARADASQQALPIRTTIDHDGFFPALALIDHLDPVTFVHSTHELGDVVTATGSVRTITEVRELRHANALSWESTVQIDVASSAIAAALLPVEDLAVSNVSDIVADFDWVNPTQPDVTPTELQFRLIGQSTLWQTTSYDGVGADAIQIGSLNPETVYEFQIRIVRRVNGLITHTSPVRTVDFVTLASTVPTPVPDGDDTDVDIPGGDEDCVVELELWENDGSGWVEVDSWDQSDMTPNGDGTWRLTTPIPNSFFNEGSVYRFVWREICGGIPGPDVIGPTFDPPDDWADPCTDPPSLGAPPYDSVDLTVYVPKVCAPDIITEAVSGIAGIHGAGYGGLLALVGDPNYRAIESNSTGGIVAYGECPQITGIVGDKTVSCRVSIADAEFQTLFECSAMRITCTPDGTGNWKAGATVFTPAGTGTCLSDALDFDTAYVLTATYEQATGDLKLYVDGVQDGDTTLGGPQNTINALPTWFAGLPPDSWITDCALWDVLVEQGNPPNPTTPTVVDVFSDAQLDAANGIVLDGDLLYVAATGADRLTIVDKTDPLNLSIVGSVTDANLDAVSKVDKVGNYAYLVSPANDRLTIVDVSNPASPSVTGALSSATRLDGATDIKVAGNFAYVIAGADNQFSIINVSNPASPTTTGGGAVTGSFIGTTSRLALSGTNAFVTCAGSARLYRVDITTPTAPTITAPLIDANLGVTSGGILIVGSLAYICGSSGDRLVIVDITTPTAPTIVGFVTDATLNNANSVAVVGNYAYVAAVDANRVTVVDVSNPASPSVVGSVQDNTNLIAAGNLVADDNNYVFVANGTIDGIVVIDV